MKPYLTGIAGPRRAAVAARRRGRSELGHSRHFDGLPMISALPSEADIVANGRLVLKAPRSDMPPTDAAKQVWATQADTRRKRTAAVSAPVRRADWRQHNPPIFPGCGKTTRRADSAFPVGQIISTSSPVSPEKRGVSRSSRTRDGMRWTRQRQACGVFAGRFSVSGQRRARRTALLRTAKPCGPDTRCWCQAVGGEIDPTGFDQPSSRQRR
jgi:hypothetical protein